MRRRLLRRSLACEELGISPRQLRRDLAGFKEHGPSYFAHGARGRPSNNRLPDDFRSLVLQTVEKYYADCSPKNAQRLLKHNDKISVNRETLRNWMIEDGLWIPRSKRDKRSSGGQSRMRALRTGEVVYVDGTEFVRPQGKGFVALHAIDEATSKLLGCWLAPAETTHGYMKLLRSVCGEFGKMIVLVSDGHASMIPRSRKKQTQFERALHELAIVYRPSDCPQSRPMVERVHRSVKQYLPSWLRRRRIRTLANANEEIDDFLKFFRFSFAVDPVLAESAFRAPTTEELDNALCWKGSPRLSLNGEAQLKNCLIQLDDRCRSRWYGARHIEIIATPDLDLRVSAAGETMEFRLISRCRRYCISRRELAWKLWNCPGNPHDIVI